MRCMCFVLLSLLALGCSWAYAAETPVAPEVRIFKGDDPSLDGIDLGNWGSGTAAKSKEQILDGSWSIKITTQGLYAGGRMDFTRPVTLFSGGVDKGRYVQFAFFFPKDTKVVNPALGTDYYSDIEPYTIPPANKIRFVFISDAGESIAVEEPTCKLDPDDNWMRVAVPLIKLKTSDDVTDFRLKRLLVMTDVPTTLALGEMKLVTDSSPIKVEALSTQSVIITEQVLWVAEANGGVSSLKYSWDFDAVNGTQRESTGMIGRYIYLRGGTFTITLTVSDVDGVKTPVNVVTTVDVND